MARIQIKATQVGATLQAFQGKVPVAIRAGLQVAAQRGKTHLQQQSPVGVAGAYRAAWHVKRELNGWSLENDAPYAGVIERGARPHKVSAEGWAAIWLWVKRVLAWQVRVERADRNFYFKKRRTLEQITTDITWAIVKKIEKHGQKPRWIVRNSMPLLAKWMQHEVDRQVRQIKAPTGVGK
jgi:hypothetical protein